MQGVDFIEASKGFLRLFSGATGTLHRIAGSGTGDAEQFKERRHICNSCRYQVDDLGDQRSEQITKARPATRKLISQSLVCFHIRCYRFTQYHVHATATKQAQAHTLDDRGNSAKGFLVVLVSNNDFLCYRQNAF